METPNGTKMEILRIGETGFFLYGNKPHELPVLGQSAIQGKVYFNSEHYDLKVGEIRKFYHFGTYMVIPAEDVYASKSEMLMAISKKLDEAAEAKAEL